MLVFVVFVVWIDSFFYSIWPALHHSFVAIIAIYRSYYVRMLVFRCMPMGLKRCSKNSRKNIFYPRDVLFAEETMIIIIYCFRYSAACFFSLSRKTQRTHTRRHQPNPKCHAFYSNLRWCGRHSFYWDGNEMSRCRSGVACMSPKFKLNSNTFRLKVRIPANNFVSTIVKRIFRKSCTRLL